MKRKLNGAILSRLKVTEEQKNTLFSLWETYYQNVDRAMFEEDLMELSLIHI